MPHSAFCSVEGFFHRPGAGQEEGEQEAGGKVHAEVKGVSNVSSVM